MPENYIGLLHKHDDTTLEIYPMSSIICLLSKSSFLHPNLLLFHDFLIFTTDVLFETC